MNHGCSFVEVRGFEPSTCCSKSKRPMSQDHFARQLGVSQPPEPLTDAELLAALNENGQKANAVQEAFDPHNPYQDRHPVAVSQECLVRICASCRSWERTPSYPKRN